MCARARPVKSHAQNSLKFCNNNVILNFEIMLFISEPRGKRVKTETPKLGRAVLDELRKEMSSTPEEISFGNPLKHDKKRKERTDYEEANFIRMNLSKVDKKKPRMESGLNSILEDTEMFNSAEKESRGGRGKFSKGGKGKKGKKFKRRKK